MKIVLSAALSAALIGLVEGPVLALVHGHAGSLEGDLAEAVFGAIAQVVANRKSSAVAPVEIRGTGEDAALTAGASALAAGAVAVAAAAEGQAVSGDAAAPQPTAGADPQAGAGEAEGEAAAESNGLVAGNH